MPHPVAAHDPSGEGIGASQHLARGIEVPRANGFADARAADHLAVQRHGGQAVYLKMQLTAQATEQGNIPAAPVAELKISADTDALDPAQLPDQLAYEGLARQMAEFAVEVDFQQRGDPEFRNHPQFLRA